MDAGKPAIEFYSYNARRKWVESVELYYYRGIWFLFSIVACDFNPCMSGWNVYRVTATKCG